MGSYRLSYSVPKAIALIFCEQRPLRQRFGKTSVPVAKGSVTVFIRGSSSSAFASLMRCSGTMQLPDAAGRATRIDQRTKGRAELPFILLRLPYPIMV